MATTDMVIPDLLTTTLVSSMGEAFEMMIGKTVDFQTDGPALPAGWRAHVAASIAFAGHRQGVVCIHSSADAAKGIAGGMLGMDPADVTDEISDAMGEVANLVVGSFRTKLAAIEPASFITVPTVTVGSDFSTQYTSKSARALYHFRMDDEWLLVELILMDR